MTIWYKQGAVGDLLPKAQKALRKVHRVFSVLKEDVFVTSMRDSTHSAGSFHHIGNAFDIRYMAYHHNRDKLVDSLKEALGPDYDVIGESNHIHIEYDPKG